MITETYTVAGMSCAHCVAAVSEELTELAGVHSVDVDLKSGIVTVVSESGLDPAAAAAAIDEAGYELAAESAVR